MSVHAAERGEDKLDVQKKAEKLIAHTVHIMTNEKVFNPKYSDFHQRIVDCAVEIGACIWEANGIRANNSERYAERHRLQERAVRKIGVLLYLMSIAKRLDKNLRRGKYDCWVHLARETKGITIAWRDSDARKFRRLIQDAGCNAQRVDAFGAVCRGSWPSKQGAYDLLALQTMPTRDGKRTLRREIRGCY